MRQGMRPVYSVIFEQARIEIPPMRRGMRPVYNGILTTFDDCTVERNLQVTYMGFWQAAKCLIQTLQTLLTPISDY